MPRLSTKLVASIFITFMVLFGILLGRVGYLQTYGRQQTIRRVERQQHMNEVLLARRGSIFDRNSMLCAGTIQGRALYIDPKFFYETMLEEGKTTAEVRKAIADLCDLADLDHRKVINLLDDRSENRFVNYLTVSIPQSRMLSTNATSRVSARCQPPSVITLWVRWQPILSAGCEKTGWASKGWR